MTALVTTITNERPRPIDLPSEAVRCSFAVSGGDPIYYGKTNAVSATSHEGTISAGESLELSEPIWVVSGGRSNCLLIELVEPATGLTSQNLATQAELEAYTLKEAQLPSSVVKGSIVTHAPTGVAGTDDTMLREAISDTPSGGVLYLAPPADGETPYAIQTSALSITKNISIIGAGVTEVSGTVAESNVGVCPTTAPYLKGSVIMQTTAAKDVIQSFGTGINVNMRDLGLRFATAIQFLNTGHGFNATPSAALEGKLQNGLFHARLDNVTVWGHDGNHYGLKMVNPILGTVTHFRSYGGGGVYIESNSTQVNYGNLVFVHPYVCMLAGGTANGYELKAGTSETPGLLNLIQFNRPQAFATGLPTAFLGLGIEEVKATQYLWRTESGSGVPKNIWVINPDLETSPVELKVDFGKPGAGTIVLAPAVFGTKLPFFSNYSAYGPEKPSVEAKTGAGTGGKINLNTNADDRGGIFSVVVGTSPAAAGTAIAVFTVQTMEDLRAVVLTPHNPFSYEVGFYVERTAATQWTLKAKSKLAEGGEYPVSYMVLPANP